MGSVAACKYNGPVLPRGHDERFRKLASARVARVGAVAEEAAAETAAAETADEASTQVCILRLPFSNKSHQTVRHRPKTTSRAEFYTYAFAQSPLHITSASETVHLVHHLHCLDSMARRHLAHGLDSTLLVGTGCKCTHL